MISETRIRPGEWEAAEALWAFHDVAASDTNADATDVGIALGSHDIGVAEHAAALYHRGRFPLIVCTGANSPSTSGVLPRGEAVEYVDCALALGVPRAALLMETRATNTSQNISFTRALLAEHGVRPRSVTLVCKPYQQRRARATARKVWPEVEVACSARRQTLRDYVATIGDPAKVLHMMVGDTQRLWLYAEAGFATPEPVDDDTRAAYDALIAAGFTARLAPEN